MCLQALQVRQLMNSQAQPDQTNCSGKAKVGLVDYLTCERTLLHRHQQQALCFLIQYLNNAGAYIQLIIKWEMKNIIENCYITEDYCSLCFSVCLICIVCMDIVTAHQQPQPQQQNNYKSGLFKATLLFSVFKLGQIPSSAFIQLYDSSKIGLLLCQSHIELRLSRG